MNKSATLLPTGTWNVDPTHSRVGLEAHGQISPADYGMKFNIALGSGNVAVSDKVKIVLDISAVKQADAHQQRGPAPAQDGAAGSAVLRQTRGFADAMHDHAPLVIQCAVTGSTDPDRRRRPNVPLAPAEIVDSALAAWTAGAAVVHLHAREADGTPTQDREAFRTLVDGLRAAGCDAILNLTCGSAGGRSVRDERLAPLELRPEMASLDCGSINFGERIFEGDLPFLRRMAQAFRDHGVRPELECFDSGHVGLALQLRDEGLLDDPLVVQFVLGVPGSGVPATVEMVEHLRRMLPAGTRWSVCAIGQAQLPLNAYCILAGGHVRTGLEDNLFYRRGERATNAQLVERVVRLAGELERPVATPEQARAILL